MAISGFTKDTFTGTFSTTASGIATFSIPCASADQLYDLRAKIFIVNPSASHLSVAGKWEARYVVANKNGTLSAPAAVTGSTNPMNANNGGLQGANVEAADSTVANSTCAWTISGTNAVLTVSAISSVGGPVANSLVGVYVEILRIGAT